MSWSIVLHGHAGSPTFRAQISKDLANAKEHCGPLEHEKQTIARVDALIMAELDFQKPDHVVIVEAHGSAYKSNLDHDSNVSVKVESLYNFVE